MRITERAKEQLKKVLAKADGQKSYMRIFIEGFG